MTHVDGPDTHSPGTSDPVRDAQVRAYEQGRRDAAAAIRAHCLDHKRAFLWADKAIDLALGEEQRE